jgi:molecular chaperone IbpA
MTHLSLPYGKTLLPSTVGFDRLLSTFDEFESLLNRGVQTYPPYNIIKEDETNYKIEIAVSGFSREDLDITFEGGKLSVDGAIKTSTARTYLHRGIGTRNFSHKFVLNEFVEVKGADIVDGLLVISLQNVVPEEKKSRKINIGK